MRQLLLSVYVIGAEHAGFQIHNFDYILFIVTDYNPDTYLSTEIWPQNPRIQTGREIREGIRIHLKPHPRHIRHSTSDP